ncbi:hypothetical protein [Microcoleus sp. B13-B4]
MHLKKRAGGLNIFDMIVSRSHFRTKRAIAFGIAGWKGAIAMQGFGMGKAIART